MNIDAIRGLYDAQPFRPFTIRTADGRSFPVPHREFMLLTPRGETIILTHLEGGFDIIDTELVTSASASKRRSSSAK
jgi:hypothetical protein